MTDSLDIVEGDLLAQPVDAIVNSWNRNIIPWWLLIPQGVSGAIKRRAGLQPFREVGRFGPIPLGGAVLTSAGRLPVRAIIHVAGINLCWRSSEFSIRQSVRSALEIATRETFASVAFPLIGAGSGGRSVTVAEWLMLEEFSRHPYAGEIFLVRYKPR